MRLGLRWARLESHVHRGLEAAASLETGTTPLAGPAEEEQQSQQLAHDWFAATVRIVG